MIPVLEDIIRGLLDGTMSPEEAKFYLDAHERLQNGVDSLADVPYVRGVVTLEVLEKCFAQDRQWGARTYPSFNTAIMSNADLGQYAVAGYHEVVNAQRARLLTANQNATGELSWMTILVEEVAKLTEKYESPQQVREQLIDVAGVAIQWAAALTPEPEFVLKVSSPQAELPLDTNGDGGRTVTVNVHVEEADHEGPNLR